MSKRSKKAETKKQINGLSRREFIRNAGIIAGGAAVVGAVGCAPAEIPKPLPWMPAKWDYEADVVVLGTGSVFPAALSAHDAGMKVIILEKHPTHFGGTTRYSGGAVSCPNSRLAQEAGKPVISRDVLLGYMKKAARGQSTDELLETLLDNYNTMANYLMDSCGFKFSYLKSNTPYYAWYHPFYPEEPIPGISCTLWAVPRDGFSFARALMAYARDAIDERKIPIMFGIAGKRLIYSGNSDLGNGEVIGIIAESGGKEIAIKATHGVIIGTGGYDHNRELVQHFLPAPMYSTVAIETNTGDGLKMGMAVGADLRNMNEAFRMPFFMTEGADVYQGTHLERDKGTYMSENSSKLAASSVIGKPGCIIVNKYGERFGNEAANYDLYPRAFETYDTGLDEWANVPAFWICDSLHIERYGLLGYASTSELTQLVVPDWVKKFDSLEQLAKGMGINYSGLAATIEWFNNYAKKGVDPAWHRGESHFDQWTSGDLKRWESGELKNPNLAPLEKAPFYAANVWPGMLQTKGGLRVNKNAQVLDVRGNVIPRLYCSSCTMAMPMGRGYGWAGSTMAPGMVFGYLAGKHAAALKPWG